MALDAVDQPSSLLGLCDESFGYCATKLATVAHKRRTQRNGLSMSASAISGEPMRAKCYECDRETEYLFPATRMVTLLTGWRRGAYPYKPRIPVYHQFMKIGLVCQRCRPPSNLEIQEILEEGKYKGQNLELRSITS